MRLQSKGIRRENDTVRQSVEQLHMSKAFMGICSFLHLCCIHYYSHLDNERLQWSLNHVDDYKVSLCGKQHLLHLCENANVSGKMSQTYSSQPLWQFSTLLAYCKLL